VQKKQDFIKEFFLERIQTTRVSLEKPVYIIKRKWISDTLLEVKKIALGKDKWNEPLKHKYFDANQG